jgi:glycosyltransferase involved in cell wall biosynthesis
MSSIPLKYAKKNNVPVRIAHSHNSNQDRDAKYLLKLFYRNKIKKYATDLFSCSIEAGKWMFKTDNFTVLNNAIDAAKYSYNKETSAKVRADLGVSDNALVIGLVARFAPQKNHNFLIDVFANLKSKNENSVLLLVGDGELKDQISAKIKNKGLESDVIFTGVRSDVNALLQAMDVFVMPSFNEGLPVSIIEAQAAGLPCVISDNVPEDCRKTDLIESLSLSVSAEIWAKTIVNNAKQPRRNTYEEICAADFDIVSNAQNLQRFYLNKE